MHTPESNERIIPLRDAANPPWMPRRRGKTLHVATLNRWARNAVGGRFMASKHDAKPAEAGEPTPEQRQRQSERAEARAAEHPGLGEQETK